MLYDIHALPSGCLNTDIKTCRFYLFGEKAHSSVKTTIV